MINNLKMAGIILHYMILEIIVDLRHKRLGVWCDNTLSVSWTAKLNSKVSVVGQQLTQALAMRVCANDSSPLAPLSIPGELNQLGDVPSRSFRATGKPGNYEWDDRTFLTEFNARFPLTQGHSWQVLRPRNRLTRRVFSLLLREPQPMGSWIRLLTWSVDIGHIGKGTAGELEWTPISKGSQSAAALTTSSSLPKAYERAKQDEAIKCELARFRTRFAPSARPSNWMSGPTPSTNPPATTTTSCGSSD